jgi:hypothetical protein
MRAHAALRALRSAVTCDVCLLHGSLGRYCELCGVIAAPSLARRSGPPARDHRIPCGIAAQPVLGVRQDFGHPDAVPIERHAPLVRRGLQEVREALGSRLGIEHDHGEALIRRARHPVASDKARQGGNLRHDLIQACGGCGRVGDGHRVGNCVHDALPHLERTRTRCAVTVAG